VKKTKMKKVYIIMAISVGLFSSVYAQENVAITDINTSPLSQAQCDVTRDFLYYEGVG
jgi:uncharacterized membrane protein YdcZ (DUF606 family)